MTHLQPTDPINPPLPWIGGKRQLAPIITQRIAGIPHKTYVEPFMGMGGVFLRRTARPVSEVINDRSQDVVTLFRLWQRHPDALAEAIDQLIAARAEFNRLVAQPPALLTDIERAARFYYIQRLTYAGKVASRHLPVSVERRPGLARGEPLRPLFRRLQARLRGVMIEHLDWRECLARYDRPTTFFYLDPPYWGVEDYYGRHLFDRNDLAALAQALRGLKGGWLLSLNDVPAIRDLFSWANLESVTLRYTVARGANRPVGELLICR